MGEGLGIDVEKEIVSEQSKKEICQAVKEQAKDYLTEEQLEEFDHIFYSVANKYTSLQLLDFFKSRQNIVLNYFDQRT